MHDEKKYMNIQVISNRKLYYNQSIDINQHLTVFVVLAEHYYDNTKALIRKNWTKVDPKKFIFINNTINLENLEFNDLGC